jgi:hypothetical protein
MAVAAGDITNFHKYPIGNGDWYIRFTYTGPASYTASGEVMTRAVCKAAMEGISEVFSLPPTLAIPSGGATGALCAFEVINDGTNTGTFHFYQGSDAHTHDFLIVGGQAAATHTHDMTIIGGQGAAGTDAVTAPAGTDILGKQEAGNAAILGADVATKGGVVASSTPTGLLMVGADTIGKAEATDRTIVGADSATKGGVVSGGSTAIAAPEVAAASDYSTYTANFFGVGRM